MNAPEKPALSLPSASVYILDNFKPTDRVAILVLNRQLGETTQRITTAQKASSPEFQAWLRYKNANGADIYIGMNALQHHASTRTKEDIEKISHVYLDIDHGGSASVEALANCVAFAFVTLTQTEDCFASVKPYGAARFSLRRQRTQFARSPSHFRLWM